MVEEERLPDEDRLIRIEPERRLVVLARTLQATGPEAESALARRAETRETCLGRALYRHRSVFRNGSEAPVWSHLELRYFRDIVPFGAVRDLVLGPQPPEVRLLRAETLVTTPGAFVMPRGWRGSTDRPGRRASLEYIHVRPAHLGTYREIMRRSVGPASAALVGMDRIGTFRAMETAAVLVQDPSLAADWNQIHLCEVDADGFEGFGPEFDGALRETSPDGGFAAVFANLGRMRTIPRWTLNDAVLEADLALARPVPASPPLP